MAAISYCFNPAIEVVQRFLAIFHLETWLFTGLHRFPAHRRLRVIRMLRFKVWCIS